jgi:hypothetical protein
MSGLSHTPGKRAWGKTHRGFESRLLRQIVNEYGLSGPFFIWLFFWASPLFATISVDIADQVDIRRVYHAQQ